jgi:arginyl-tRNA synthetase
MPEVQEYPPDSAFGDITPVSFSLAKLLRRNRGDRGRAAAMSADPLLVDRIEVAGAGYLNIFVAKTRWRAVIPEVLAAETAYGRAGLWNGRRVQVEFVSANPTGPLHVGHGRGAALGDAVARLLEAVGYQVEREFYVNDAGTQVRLLGESVWARLQEAAGRANAFPRWVSRRVCPRRGVATGGGRSGLQTLETQQGGRCAERGAFAARRSRRICVTSAWCSTRGFRATALRER